MAKLKDIEKTKGKTGDYYGLDDVLGEEIEIVEAVTADSEIREYKTKKENVYYCVKVRHTEEKDLHLTKAALLALADVMPKNEPWQGYKVRINRTGSGFNTAYKIVVTGKGIGNYAEAPPQGAIADSRGKIITYLKQAPAGMQDKPFWDAVLPLCGSFGDAMAVVEKLKNEGRIINQDGIWRVV